MRAFPKSISRKITWMNMLVSGTALLLAGTAFFAYDQVTFRQGLVHALSAQAQIVGSNSIAALLFNDPQTAANTLSALKSSPNIESAGIFTLDRKPFATYVRDGGPEALSIPTLSDPQKESYWFRSTHLILAEPIIFQGQPLGFVYIRSDLREIDQRLRRYAAIAFVVLLLSLVAASIVSSLFRKSVVTPIVTLADVARSVSQEKNYSVRALPSGEHDEVALLVEAFNEMLAQIQRRDEELQRGHAELERRVAERTRELLVANRELEAFSYSVSHDLRGPVDAINGFSYVLSKEYSRQLDAKGNDLIDRIRGSGRRMMQLIDDLLNLSRVTSGALQLEPVDLTAIARSVCEELQRSNSERQVEFVIGDGNPVEGDPRLLRVVIDNLLRNAWKYTSNRPSAKIEFGVQTRDGAAIYFVRDNGVGFDPRSSSRLFQPFQRLHSAEEFPGNGIGLATVQRIVRRHGGGVWAESEVGKGAVFYFSLSKPNASGSPSLPGSN
jgi:signal transduction histidine kinase